MEILKQLHINIPLIKAIEQMPNYSKFMKDMLIKRKRLGEFATIALTQECSQLVQGKLPPKLKDPGNFTIPCNIDDLFGGKALCDLGESINLIPLSIFKKLGIGASWPTTITLQLADKSICYPQGNIEDVLVRVDKFVFPADFIIMDFDANEDILILLGRHFLATVRTLIDVEKGELTMRVNGQQVVFNVMNALQYPEEEVADCLMISYWDRIVHKSLLKSIDVLTQELGKVKEILQEGIMYGPMNQSVVKKEHMEEFDLKADQNPHSPSIEVPPELELKQLPAHL
ncbi:uncharacterized protein LOC131624648 [Vicia villosa]|uniref:uncharacterized protein LOC131624648 n=1 Tax=Vicia villosa TaxID=3911 RepID=UPI00273CAFD4|nr:uncharacterized protein LOC131624648 [Vicia villosa]